MKKSDFTTTIVVNKAPSEVFNAINNVRGWWSSTLEGNSEKLNDEFTYRYKDLHYSKQRLIEVIPGKKVAWLVTDSALSFVKKTNEWDGTIISFEIAENNGRTTVNFTHTGLTTSVECFDACSGGWNHYLHQSLAPLINQGFGNPD
jgi:hypothetical protein